MTFTTLQSQASERSHAEETGDAGLAGIGEMARRYGVTLRALRFYEDRGLLRPHRVGNARLYDAPMRARLQLILKGKQLGFTLGEIRRMLDGGADGADETGLPLDDGQIAAQLDMLERQREQLERAIVELRAARSRMAGFKTSPDEQRHAG